MRCPGVVRCSAEPSRALPCASACPSWLTQHHHGHVWLFVCKCASMFAPASHRTPAFGAHFVATVWDHVCGHLRLRIHNQPCHRVPAQIATNHTRCNDAMAPLHQQVHRSAFSDASCLKHATRGLPANAGLVTVVAPPREQFQVVPSVACDCKQQGRARQFHRPPRGTSLHTSFSNVLARHMSSAAVSYGQSDYSASDVLEPMSRDMRMVSYKCVAARVACCSLAYPYVCWHVLSAIPPAVCQGCMIGVAESRCPGS